jgi:hypothetical protein
VLALFGSLAVLGGVLAAIAVANQDGDEVVEVATAATLEQVDPLTDPDGPGYERGLTLLGRSSQQRADAAQEDAALAAAAAMAEQEAAAAAAAQQAAAAEEEEQAAAAPPPTTAPPEPWPSPDPTPPPVQGDPFDAIAQCESGRNPQAYNPAGPWYGAFQFSQGTWNQFAPEWANRDPRTFSYAQQKTVAQRLQAARGWGAWPHCSQQLGLA